MTWPRLRVHEWMLLGFFAYLASISPLFMTRPMLHGQPFVALLVVLFAYFVIDRLQRSKLAMGVGIARDWLPVIFLLLAFRELNYFVPRQFDFLTEMSWIRWDWILLDGYKWRAKIEALGPVLPFYLETCYLIVYGLSLYCVGRLSALRDRKGVNRFWTIFLLGTLGCYVLVPYFPTESPRFSFPDIAPPTVITPVRGLNVLLLNVATSHAGVFPSAHVSAAFSCAFAMLLLMPGRREGWLLLICALSVSVATVYGRYDYFVDALAGFGISLLPAALCLLYYAHDVKEKAKVAS